MNCLGGVFNKKASDHDEFRPVHDWIIHGKGKMVYGGTKYKKELKKATKYRKLLVQLKKAGKIVELNDKEVNKCHGELDAAIKHSDFDDPHLIAIIIVSGCKLICSLDKRAYKFIKKKALYPTHIEKPKIYGSKSNSDLLSDENIAKICRPASKPNRLLKNLLEASEAAIANGR